MKHIVIDLEMNQVKGKSKARAICRMETIEIGAVMLDDNLSEVSCFQTYVKSEYNQRIEPTITHLTGITTDMVQNAPTFNEAFGMFLGWCLGTNDEVTIYAWSCNDYNRVIKEILLKGYEMSAKEKVLMDEEWSDFQREFDSHLGFDRDLSLSMALDMAGVTFSGRKHDALDDAKNTAELLRIFRDEKLFDKALSKIKEAMEPTPIGSAIGDLFDFSKILSA